MPHQLHRTYESHEEALDATHRDRYTHHIKLDSYVTDHCIDGTKVSHFRGRKLKGKTVQLPTGYKGNTLVEFPFDHAE